MHGANSIEAVLKDTNPNFKRPFLFALLSLDVAISAAVADWGLKFFMRDVPARELIPGILSLTSHHNYGLMANVPLPLWLIISLSILALFALAYAYKQAWIANSFMQCLALALVLGGALGNLADRLMHGFVFDYLMLFNTSIINFADIAIAVGLVIYVLTSGPTHGKLTATHI